jgi:hypothetical protein
VPTEIPFSPVNHIENRRLFDAAFGVVRLETRERLHVHECRVCQGVFYLFVIQEAEPQAAAKQQME